MNRYLTQPLAPCLPYTRALVLDAAAARTSAPAVAALLAHELGRDEAWQAEQVRAFGALADLAQVVGCLN